jgi:AAA domain
VSPAKTRAPDPLPGTPTFVRLEWHGNQYLPQRGDEVRLAQNRKGDLAVRTARATASVAVVSGADRRHLDQIRVGAAPYVAIVVDSLGRGQGRQWGEIAVTFFRFDSTAAIPPHQVGVDDRVASTIAKWERTQAYVHRTDRVIDWLTGHFLLPPEPGETDTVRGRIIFSAVREGSAESASYRLHGRGVTADVQLTGDRLLLRRLRRPTARDRQRVLRLAYTAVEFTDATLAGERRASMRPWIDKLAAGQGFLAMWEEYNRVEARYLGDLVRRTGKARFDEWNRLSNGNLRFTTPSGASSPDGEARLIDSARDALERGEDLEVEAAEKLPGIFSGEDPDAGDGESPDRQSDDWGFLGHRQGRHAFTGTAVDVDPTTGTITLRPTARQDSGMPGVGGDKGIQLKQAGWLHRSYRGDQRQIERRKRAFDRLLANGTYIPNLLALLEGQHVDARPPGKRIRPESEAAWAIFEGSPTRSQWQAIDLALNTPDIAVIQGPPGTGKTDVIAAIQTRLAEQGKSYAELRGSMLLASFQHSAVEEAASRSVILGIPSDKIDRTDRGALPLRDRLRDDAVSKLDAGRRNSATPEQVRSLRELNRKAAEYWLDPPDMLRTAALLEEALRIARPHIPAALAVRLGEAADKLTINAGVGAGRPVLSDAHELALAALRGLRTAHESFADDGPRTAAKALRRIQALPEPASPGDIELLTRAADWAGEQPPDFLDELRALRDRVTDRLLRPAGPTPVPAADPEVTALLDETVTEMEESLRRLADVGVHLVLEDYRESLQGDPDAVEWTLRAYTASYATTCQQADSPKMTQAKGVRSEDDVVFDTVIIDEAARANPLDLMIPMSLAARRIVLVGDHHQLPPMLEPDVEQQVLRDNEHATGALRKSLFQRLFEAHHDSTGPPVRRVVTLDEQFRMHEALGTFVSDSFYAELWLAFATASRVSIVAASPSASTIGATEAAVRRPPVSMFCRTTSESAPRWPSGQVAMQVTGLSMTGASSANPAMIGTNAARSFFTVSASLGYLLTVLIPT